MRMICRHSLTSFCWMCHNINTCNTSVKSSKKIMHKFLQNYWLRIKDRKALCISTMKQKARSRQEVRWQEDVDIMVCSVAKFCFICITEKSQARPQPPQPSRYLFIMDLLTVAMWESGKWKKWLQNSWQNKTNWQKCSWSPEGRRR